jgi:NosR/NirI family nitrous oxide reductase transcriptional regulator
MAKGMVWKERLIQAYRVGLLAAIVFLLRAEHEWVVAQRGVVPAPMEVVGEFFPEADALGSVDVGTGGQVVLDGEGKKLGMVVQTSPAGNAAVGYAGPTNVLVAFDVEGRSFGGKILGSADTEEHVAMVEGDEEFWAGFKDRDWDELAGGEGENMDGVSGATLTSLGIREAIWLRTRGGRPNLKFPMGITVEEVGELFPGAASLELAGSRPPLWEVLDGNGLLLGYVARTAHLGGDIKGYAGPTDVLLGMDAARERLVGIRVRKSYDTADYVKDIERDYLFFKKFEGVPMAKLMPEGGADHGIEGVSGATMTSRVMVEGLQVTLGALSAGGEAELRMARSWRVQDLVMFGVIGLALVMAFTKLRRLGWVHRLYQVFLVVYVGFIGGDMLAQALLVGWAKSGVGWATAPGLVALVVMAFVVPIATGRQVYCHHVCPHGAAQQLIGRWGPKRWHWKVPKGWDRWLGRLPTLLLLWVMLVAMLALGFDLAGIEPFDAYVWKVAGGATVTVFVVSLVVSLFVPMAYCRYGCPTGHLLEFVRYHRRLERFGLREWAGGVMFLVALGLYLARDVLAFL